MPNHTDNPDLGHPLPPWRKVQNGIKIFVVLTAIGLVVVLYRSSFQASFRHLQGFRWQFLLLATTLMFFDWFASGARIWVFASRLQKDISFRGCVRASLANIFLGGVTPSQTGGGPGQIYVLYKEGMPLFDAVVVSFLGGFLGTALFLPACGFLVLVLHDPVGVDFRLQYVVKGSIIAFGLIVLVAVIGLMRPDAMQRAVRHLVGWFPPLGRWLARKGVIDILMGLIDRYHHMMVYFLRRAKIAFLIGFLLTGLIYFNKFVIAWVVLRGLGVEADFWEVVYAQLVLILIFYFAPSPGAAGVAEVSTAEIMKGIIPVGCEGAFVVLWRAFTLFISLAVGAVFTIRALYHDRAAPQKPVVDYRNQY